MPIANAIQRGSVVYVYNEKNQQIFAQHAGNGPDDGLKAQCRIAWNLTLSTGA